MLSPPGAGAAAAQVPTITLAEAIRRAERVQPAMVRAAADVRTAEARRRSALGNYLPTLSASSAASDFFSEGAGRIDPVTGQLTSGNSSNRSLSASLSAFMATDVADPFNADARPRTKLGNLSLRPELRTVGPSPEPGGDVP